jgi:hypothetical protein
MGSADIGLSLSYAYGGIELVCLIPPVGAGGGCGRNPLAGVRVCACCRAPDGYAVVGALLSEVPPIPWTCAAAFVGRFLIRRF